MKSYLCLLFCLVQSLCVFGNKDSLISVIKSTKPAVDRLPAYGDLVFEMYLSNPDSAILIAQQGLNLAGQEGDIFEKASLTNGLGLAYFRKGWYAKAVDAFLESIKLFEELKNQEQIARVYLNIGQVYQARKDYNAAQQYNLKALEQFELLNDSFRIACSYQTLNVVCRELKDFEASGSYIDRSISILGKLGKSGELANSYTLKGNLLKAQGKYQDAIPEFKKALSLYDGTSDLSNKAIAFENLGSAYYELKNYDKSIQHYSKALSIFKEINSEMDQAYERMKLSMPQASMGDFISALSNLDSAEYYFKIEQLPDFLSELYIHKSEVLSMQGMPAEALEAFRLHVKLKDSLDDARKSDELFRLQAEYDTDQKEKQIETLQTETSLKEGQLYIRNIIIVSMIVLVLMGIYLFISLRNRRKLEDELSKQKLLNRIAGDLHDDVGSTLSSIKMYGDVLRTKAASAAPQLVPLAEKISENAKEMIQSMSDIVWTIKPGQDNLPALHDRIWNVGLELCSPGGINFKISELHELDHTIVDTELRHDLFMICKEAINNAVKYASCTEIQVSLTAEEKLIKLIIEDNGCGIMEDAVRGNGLNNMERRCIDNRGKFEILTGLGRGTKIIALIPF
ncbi:MAG: tetratricopeptide repeat protein [Bacteroidetes bacterium]|nr:tetratricopeptide repeat protein [Bacteroidota bacterium]